MYNSRILLISKVHTIESWFDKYEVEKQSREKLQRVKDDILGRISMMEDGIAAAQDSLRVKDAELMEYAMLVANLEGEKDSLETQVLNLGSR